MPHLPQTSEINGFGRFGRIRSVVVRRFRPRPRPATTSLPTGTTAPNYGYQDYPAYGGYGYRGYGNGHDEIRELQRLFPSTNWPPSMRYYSQ